MKPGLAQLGVLAPRLGCGGDEAATLPIPRGQAALDLLLIDTGLSMSWSCSVCSESESVSH